MIIFKRKYPCIFCGRRYTDLYCRKNHIGICSTCLTDLKTTPQPCAFQGSRGIDYVVSPLYYTGKVRDAVLDLKFNNFHAYGELLSRLMCDLLSGMPHLSEFDLVVPVPLSKKRFIERGYNQAALIAKPFAEFFGVDYSENTLYKIRETKRQSRLSNKERLTNVQGAFEARADLTDKRILLVDDIFTTGSTMSACADALKQKGAANIAGVSLAIREEKRNIFNILNGMV